MSRKVIFQELCVIGGDILRLIPFVHAFYAFEFPLFYNLEGDITIIPFVMGIRQCDLLGGALFPLTHFRALCSTTSHFPSCLFPSIIDDTQIIGPLSIVSSTYEHFQIELCVIGFFIQPQKCVAWSPFDLQLDFNTPS
jgi:hypothetical protein